MTTKILALSLGVAMLSGIGIASADTVVGIGAQSKTAAQSEVVRLTDKQMDEFTAGRKASTASTSTFSSHQFGSFTPTPTKRNRR